MTIARPPTPTADDPHAILPTLLNSKRLLGKLVRKYAGLDRAVEIEDLEQEMVIAAIEAQTTWDSVRGRHAKHTFHLYRYGQKQMQKQFRGHDILVDILDRQTGETVGTMPYSQFRKQKRHVDKQRFEWRTRSRLTPLSAQLAGEEDETVPEGER